LLIIVFILFVSSILFFYTHSRLFIFIYLFNHLFINDLFFQTLFDSQLIIFSTHPSIYPPNSFILLLIHSFVRFFHASIHSFRIHSCIHPSMHHLFIYSTIHSFIHSFILFDACGISILFLCQHQSLALDFVDFHHT